MALAVLGLSFLLGLLPLLPVIPLPSIWLPEIPLPELSLDLPSFAMPEWILELLDRAKLVAPVVIGLLATLLEVRRRRRDRRVRTDTSPRPATGRGETSVERRT